MYSKWADMNRKGLSTKRGSNAEIGKIKMTGQERGDVLSGEIDVHEVGEHLVLTRCIARRAGDRLLLPNARTELCKKEEEYLERNTRMKLREPGLSSENKMKMN